MAEKLIKHLAKLSEEHSHLKLLEAQWNFDKELIPKALQNIAFLFPHYSRHDVSHSRKILINIERLLGDTLTSLSTTDTWLLLEAAYWHDIGMIVTSNDVQTDIQSNEFKQYINKIASQNGHELQEFTKKFSSLDPINCFSASETPQQAVEQYRQLLAGWYRLRHSDRAEVIVCDPWEKTGITSPRNELVPLRLFRILGQICKIHGSGFDTILNSLPFSETGMATENCHPRFIACLLRLGDLFDLDDNRFCPVMLRVAGEIPPSSQTHIDKHLAIRHFRLDPNRIEISAECQNYEAYEATDQWFRWIEDELRNQMSHWNDIVPNRLFGLLPTLGKLEVNLAPPHEILDPGQRPRFGVDPQKTIELLQGSGIYRDKWQSLRELLQNAVDANLMRIWLTHGENFELQNDIIDWSDPLSESIKKIFSRYPIEVCLTKKGENQSGQVSWQLNIRDRGIGISKKDLKYMKSVGASSKNSNRQAIINRMPDWMRPSGAFGIGLQSAFLISSKVEFESKNIFNNEALKITMMSPIGHQRGLIYVQRIAQIPGKDSGSLLTLEIETKAIPERVSLSLDTKMSFAASVLADFDPVLMLDVPYEAAMMVDEILRFSTLSQIPIHLTFNREKITNDTSNAEGENIVSFFYKESGVKLISPHFDANQEWHRGGIAFRGQRIEKYIPRIPFVFFQADILAESASETLTINRNDIKDSARKHIDNILLEAITGYLKSEQGALTTPEEQYAASAFLICSGKESERPDLKDLWKNIVLKEIGKTISDLCNETEFKIFLQKTTIKEKKSSPDELPVISSSELSSHRYSLFLKEWKDQNGYIRIELAKDLTGSELKFSKEPMPPFCNEYIKEDLLKRLKGSSTFVGGRSSIPAWGEFEKLSADVYQLGWVRSLSGLHRNYDHFVLPFFFACKRNKVTTEGLDELCAWTAKHATHIGVKKAEIKDLYNVFIKWVDDEIMAESEEWKAMRS